MRELIEVIGRPDISRPLRNAAVVVVVFFGAFLSWSLLASLESAAISSGKLGSEGKQKTIEHLEGGIVEAILVKDGDRVRAGQPLIRLDKTQAQANLDLLQMRSLTARALRARLMAERDHLLEINFGDLQDLDAQADVPEILAGQRNIFYERLQSRQEKIKVLNHQAAQYQAEITGLKNEITYQNQSIAISEGEVESYLLLEKKGMSAGKIRRNALQRQLADLKGSRSKSEASISRGRQKVAETKLRISAFKADNAGEVVQELKEVQSQIFDLSGQIRAANDILARTNINAVVDGTVVGLQVHSKGAVINPGEVLMGIVPDNGALIIEARINPFDIDVVRAGLPAHVRLTALSSRSYPSIKAKVIKISADRFTDERTGETYFEAEVALTEDLTKWHNQHLLHPGMQAEVMIVTGYKTPMDYLLEPIMESFNRAFRES